MNKKRRESLDVAINYINMGKDLIKNVKDEEELAYDNLPENLQCSDRAFDMEEKIENMEEVIDKIDDIISLIEDVRF